HPHGGDPMNDKARLLHEADEAFSELRQAVDGLDDARLTRVWLGTWSIREILIHVSGWHHEMTPALARVARGEAAYPAGTYDDFDTWNARFVQDRAGAKMPDVLAALDASHRDFVRAAGSVPDAHFAAGGGARRLAYAAVGGRSTHHNASFQVFAEGAERTRLVWIADLLPDEVAGPVGEMMEAGSRVMKRTLEAVQSRA